MGFPHGSFEMYFSTVTSQGSSARSSGSTCRYHLEHRRPAGHAARHGPPVRHAEMGHEHALCLREPTVDAVPRVVLSVLRAVVRRQFVLPGVSQIILDT